MDWFLYDRGTSFMNELIGQEIDLYLNQINTGKRLIADLTFTTNFLLNLHKLQVGP